MYLNDSVCLFLNIVKEYKLSYYYFAVHGRLILNPGLHAYFLKLKRRHSAGCYCTSRK